MKSMLNNNAKVQVCPDHAEMSRRHLSKARYYQRKGMLADARAHFAVAKGLAEDAARNVEMSR